MTVLFPAMWEFYKLPVFVTTLLWHSRTLAPTSALALAIMIYSEANGSVHVSPYWYCTTALHSLCASSSSNQQPE
jgi:hypothetical protein